jgi:hypothetical protein
VLLLLLRLPRTHHQPEQGKSVPYADELGAWDGEQSKRDEGCGEVHTPRTRTRKLGERTCSEDDTADGVSVLSGVVALMTFAVARCIDARESKDVGVRYVS